MCQVTEYVSGVKNTKFKIATDTRDKKVFISWKKCWFISDSINPRVPKFQANQIYFYGFCCHIRFTMSILYFLPQIQYQLHQKPLRSKFRTNPFSFNIVSRHVGCAIFYFVILPTIRYQWLQRPSSSKFQANSINLASSMWKPFSWKKISRVSSVECRSTKNSLKCREMWFLSGIPMYVCVCVPVCPILDVSRPDNS